MSTLTSRLTDEGTADVSPVKRRIANSRMLTDGRRDAWLKGCKNVEERADKGNVLKEQKRRKRSKNDMEGGQRSEGSRVRGLSPSGSSSGCNLTSKSS